MSGASLEDRNKRRKNEETEGVIIQSSGRISKRPRRDYDPYSPPKKTGTKKAVNKRFVFKNPTERKTKGGREISIWDIPDKKNFFEGLKEHGRDWKALHAYLLKHNRGKNNVDKSKEHIRQFYYRSWHKISKYLKCPEGVDRQALELFGLICYGEIRKKIGFFNMDATMGAKLTEMVFKGVTYLRHRKHGSRKVTNYTLKTPHCTMLEKLNNLEGIKLHQRRSNAIKLPNEVVVELRPKTNDAWAHVQALSHNPRIRAKAHPEKRLSSFIDYMDKKWKSHRLRTKENMNEPEKPTHDIVLYPPSSCTLIPWDVTRLKPSKPNPEVQQSLGLENYIRILENMSSPTVPKAAKKTTSRLLLNEQRDTGAAEPVDRGCAGTSSEVAEKPFTLSENPFSVFNEGSPKITLINTATKLEPRNDCFNSPEPRPKFIKRESETVVNVVRSLSAPAAEESEATCEVSEEVLKKIETVKGGFNRQCAETLTVADLYLMMGMPDKIVLEYEWVERDQNADVLNLGELTHALRRLIDLAKTQSAELVKSKLASQTAKVDDAASGCTCGASNVNTPPSSKRGRRAVKASTPKAARRSSSTAQDIVDSPLQIEDVGQFSSSLFTSSDGSLRIINVPQQDSTVQSLAADGIFKVPASVAPRPNASSVITVNNIAQNLSPNALMEQINRANKHTDIFLPPRRQRKSRVRRPMIIERKICPKPFLDLQTQKYSQNAPFTAPKQPISKALPSGYVMKVMNPSDVRSVTVKSVVGPKQHIAPVLLCSSNNQTATSQSSLNRQMQGQPQYRMSTAMTASAAVGSDPNQQAAPIMNLSSFLAYNQYESNLKTESLSNSQLLSEPSQPHTVFNLSNSNLLSQAALSSGIPIGLLPDSNDGFQTRSNVVEFNTDHGFDASGNMNSLSAFLDLSLPAAPEGGSDRMLDFTLNNSNSSFSVSALLDSGKMSHKDSSQDFSQLSSSNFSPSKVFKNLNPSADDSWLTGEDFTNLLSQSSTPCKVAHTFSHAHAAGNLLTSHAPATVTSVTSLNEASRDSVIGKPFDISVVDGTIQSMMNENSLDYMAKFADLAREIGATPSDDKSRDAANQ